jgi:alpha-tubulin suppressor-like RCC1 family protein
MSIRQYNLGSINKPGFNPLGAQTTTYNYYLYSWGQNAQGQLGLNNTTDYSSPKQIGSLSTWLTITSCYRAVHAIKADGTLWAWGQASLGALGNSTAAPDISSPIQIGALTAWSQVSNAYACSAAIKTDGTLWTWGYNQYGQLGNGGTANTSSPVQVGALTNWLTITAGNYSFISIKTDGTLWTWGRNNLFGQLGLGNTTNYSSPKQVGALTTWSKVFAGGGHCGAVKTDGTLWMWGRNTNGQLGLGNTTNYSSPKQVGALTTWLTMGAGNYSTYGITTAGALWSWGNNRDGQLGLSNVTYRSSPNQVGALTNWLRISGGYYFCSATKTDGTLWTWGRNANGNLGLGNTTKYSSPKQVGSLTTWGGTACTFQGNTSMFASLY